MNVLVNSSLQPTIKRAEVVEVKNEIEKTFKSLKRRMSLSVPKLRMEKKSTRKSILLKAAEKMLELT